MANLINLVPFLAAGSLLINPILYITFRRWEINIQKLRFWYMVSSAFCWILLILALIINPENEISLGYLSETGLLPGPVFLLDWISISLGLTIGGLVLFFCLSQIFIPAQLAWISGIGGVSILGALSGSVYTLLFFWALIEIFWITYSALYQSRDRGLTLPVAFRLLVPLLLLYASGVGSTDLGDSFSAYKNNAAPFLIVAGGLGIGAWIPFRRRLSDDESAANPEFAARLFPAGLSLMLITRGAVMSDPGQFHPSLPVLVAILTLLAGLLGLISRSDSFSRRIWSLGLLGMIAGCSVLGLPIGSLGWGLVFLLPTSSLFFPIQERSRMLLVMIVSALGLLTLPYLPAWIGRGLFGKGVIGAMFCIGAGLTLGGILQEGIARFRNISSPNQSIPLLDVISPMIILLTQVILAFPHFSSEISSDLMSHPFLVWIPLPLILLTIFIRFQIRSEWSIDPSERPGRTLEMVPGAVYWIVDLGDRILSFVTSLFEGEGGLIWALLIGFLIITLITIQGGS